MVNPVKLVGRVDLAELEAFFGSEVGADSFAMKAAEADETWYYDNSGRDGSGMHIGTEGIVALRGCEVLAEMVLVIYN